MKILNYLAGTERRYDFRIKSLLPLDDATLDRIEGVIMKYNPLDMGRTRKTILQARPMDFPRATNAEVHMVDIGLGLPASAGVMRTEISRALNVSEDAIVVHGANDPLEAQGDDAEAAAALDAEAAKKGLVRGARLSTTADYPDAPEVDTADYFGDAYNNRLVAYLAKVANEAAELRKVDAPAPLFKWMDMPASDVENQTPLPGKVSNAAMPHLTATGNFDSDSRRLARVYDGKGGRTVLTAEVKGVRKGDRA